MKVRTILAFPFILLIKFYQLCISPLKPPTCRYTPTCSQYALEAFRKYGPLKGFWCINRILGIEALDVGCKTVRVRPFLGDLEWAEGAMALPGGEAVRVRVSKNAGGNPKVEVDAPTWVKVVRE